MSPRPDPQPRHFHVVEGLQLELWELRANGWLPAGPVEIPAAAVVDLTAGDIVEIRHPEGLLLGTVTLERAPVAEGAIARLHGQTTVAIAAIHYDHQDLRHAVADIMDLTDVTPLVVPLFGIPSVRAVEELNGLSRKEKAPVLLVTMAGGRSAGDVDLQTIIRAHRLLRESLLAGGVRVDHVLVPVRPDADAGQVASLAAAVGGTLARSGPELDGLPAGVSSHTLRSPLNRSVRDALAAADTPPDIADMLFRRGDAIGRPGVAVLFTGLSGSGKSTVAGALMSMLHARTDRRVTLLDGDHVRRHLSSELGFSRDHRDLNVTRIGFVAAEVAKHGGVAIAAPIAPYAQSRQRVRDMVSAVGEFLLVHVATPLEVCEARDRKGLYAKARRGEIAEFTGISDPYDVPTDADIVLDTSQMGVEEAAELVFTALGDRGLL